MATKQEIIDRLSQCGGLSYQDWIRLLDSIYFYGDIGDIFIPVTSKVLPENENSYTVFSIITEGTYTQEVGAPIVVPEGYISIISNSGDSWANNGSVKVKGDTLVPSDVMNSNDILKGRAIESYSVSKDILFESTNHFNKNDVISNVYIDTTTGSLQDFANSSVSQWIPVVGWESGFISGRNSTPVNNIRFKDIAGNILKPVDDNGDELSSFNIGYQNGIFYVPTNAVAMQMQITFNGAGSTSSLQVDKGSQQTEYKEFGYGKIKYSFLKETLINVTTEDNGDIYVRSDINGDNRDILIKFSKHNSPNKIYNITSAKLLGKNKPNSDEGLPLNGSSDDESAPIRINGMFLGANHGNTGAKIFISNGHGKTLADVGSTWLDSDGQVWILLKVINVNELLIISTNRGTETEWDFKSAVAGNLTHQSGAVHTSTIVNGGIVNTQLYPSIKNLQHKIVLDGSDLSSSGIHSGEKLVLLESYDIVDTVDMLYKLVANKPIGGYTTQPDFTDGDSLVTINNNYTVSEKCTVLLDWSFIVRKECSFTYYGATQSEFYFPSWATSISRMYPNSLPISDGVTTRDFRVPVNITSTTYASEMNLTDDYWENPQLPVFRSVDGLGGIVNVNFNIGFLPVLSQENRVDQVNNAWYLYTTKKQYPYAIDNKIGTVLPVNTNRSGSAFRGWSERSLSRYNEFTIERNGKAYIFLDYVSSVLDKYYLPNKFIGKDVTVYDSSENLEVLTDVIFDHIDIYVDTSLISSGRLVLTVDLK